MCLARGLQRGWWSRGTPTWGRGPRRCPDGSGPTRGAPSARAPGSVLSLRGNAAEVGDAMGRYGCHGVGRELRNEGSVDPRMVTIPQVEEEPVQVGKLRTRGGTEARMQARTTPAPSRASVGGDRCGAARLPSERAAVPGHPLGLFSLYLGGSCHSLCHTHPRPGPHSFCTQALVKILPLPKLLEL